MTKGMAVVLSFATAACAVDSPPTSVPPTQGSGDTEHGMGSGSVPNACPDTEGANGGFMPFVPSKIAALEPLSAHKVHLSTFPPHELPGVFEAISFGYYDFCDPIGRHHQVRPGLEDPYNFTVDGLTPGTTYAVTACNLSWDNIAYCNPIWWHFTMPIDVRESNPPTVGNTWADLIDTIGGKQTALFVIVDDDTGMDHVDFFTAQGLLIATARQPVPFGFGYPGGATWEVPVRAGALGDTSAPVEVLAYDVFGNVTSTAAPVALP